MSPITRAMRKRKLDVALFAPVEQSPPIFALDVDCMDETFDYFSLADLCSIGRTCKRLHHAAGKYFAQNYPHEPIQFRELRIDRQHLQTIPYVGGEHVTNFLKYARSLFFDGINLKQYRYAAANDLTNLKTIVFGRIIQFYSDEHYSCIEKLNLAQVETVIIFACSDVFCYDLLDRILKSCTNLKSLMLKHIYDGGAENFIFNWGIRRCPSLERFEMENNADDVNFFLRMNPEIKKLSLKLRASHFNVIQTIGMELDELEFVADVENYAEARDEMIDLVKEGYVKHLKLFIRHNCNDSVQLMNDFKDVDGLVSLKIERFDFDRDAAAIAQLVNLKRLHFNTSAHMTLDSAELFSNSLVNLEELHLWNVSLFEAMPFARRLPKLRIITAEQESKSNIDLWTLNEDRKKLTDSQVLKIYLADKAYNQIRWASLELFFDLVQVRRYKFKGIDVL